MKTLRLIKIKHRLIIVFLLVSILPLLLIGYVSYNIYFKSITSKLNTSTEQSLALMRNNILVETEKLQYVNNSITMNTTIEEGLQLHPSSPPYAETKSKIDTIMQRMIYLPYIKNIRIITNKKDILYDTGYENISSHQLNSIINDIENSSSNMRWTYVNTFRNSDILIAGTKIGLLSNDTHPLGYVLFFIDERLFSKGILSNIDHGTDSNLLLVSTDGNILSSSNPADALGQPYTDFPLLMEASEKHSANNREQGHTFGNNQQSISFIPIPSMNCFLVSEIPFSYISSETRAIKKIIYILVSVITLICLMVITVLYSSIIIPIDNIMKGCHFISDGDLSVRIHDDNPDEIGFLAKSVDYMVGEMEQLIIQQQDNQQRKRALELQMLQHQINPHFLFNTLNTFKWIADINNVGVISNGIGALSDLLKSTIINHNEYITLREEIDNLNNYFEIQRIRYADSFTVSYDLDETLLDCIVLKFFLQPIVENAIIHAIDGKQITISIDCKIEGDHLIITVADNGKGFDSSTLNPSDPGKLTGIGIYNVQERLRLSFGHGYGLIINSKVGHGTSCIIKTPLDFKEEL